MSDEGSFMERLNAKKGKETKIKAMREAQKAVEELLVGAGNYDLEVAKNPVKYVNLLLDDFVEMKVAIEELLEYLNKYGHTDKTLRIEATKFNLEKLMKRFR